CPSPEAGEAQEISRNTHEKSFGKGRNMPILKNQKHERLAQMLAQGKSATEAMAEVGYADPRNSTRLTKKEEIAARIDELKENAAERAEITTASLIAELDEALKIAIEDRNPNAVVAAVKEKGVLSGKRVERSEQGQPGEFDDIEKMG